MYHLQTPGLNTAQSIFLRELSSHIARSANALHDGMSTKYISGHRSNSLPHPLWGWWTASQLSLLEFQRSQTDPLDTPLLLSIPVPSSWLCRIQNKTCHTRFWHHRCTSASLSLHTVCIDLGRILWNPFTNCNVDWFSDQTYSVLDHFISAVHISLWDDLPYNPIYEALKATHFSYGCTYSHLLEQRLLAMLCYASLLAKV